MDDPSDTSSETLNCINTPSDIKSLNNELEACRISIEPSKSGFLVSSPKHLTPDSNYPRVEYSFIMIGPLETPLYIHKDIESPETRRYFKKVFGKHGLRMSTPGHPCAYLPSDDWYSVAMFLSWTSHQSLTSTDKFVYKKEICTMEERLDLFEKVLNLNLFAEKYRITELQDDSLALFIQLCREDGCPLSVAHVKKCYDNTTKDAKIRQFLLHLTLWIIRDPTKAELKKRGWEMKEIISTQLNGKDTQLEKDLRALVFHPSNSRDWKAPDPRSDPACEFHQHGRGRVCPYEKDDGFQLLESIDPMDRVMEDTANNECIDEPKEDISPGDEGLNKHQTIEKTKPQWGIDLVDEILRPSKFGFRERLED